jgi:hypothetical protein
MTIEKAMRLASKWASGGVCTLKEGEAVEYHKICYEALKALKTSGKGDSSSDMIKKG